MTSESGNVLTGAEVMSSDQISTRDRSVPMSSRGQGPHLATMGSLVLLVGVVGLAVSGVLRMQSDARLSDGSLPACALVLTLFGLALCFPTLLQDGSSSGDAPNVSTMRIAVLMIVSVIALVTVKAGWSTTTLADLKLDPSFAWLLAAALGGKAAQSFAENGSPKG